jgi:hypothetical protein
MITMLVMFRPEYAYPALVGTVIARVERCAPMSRERGCVTDVARPELRSALLQICGEMCGRNTTVFAPVTTSTQALSFIRNRTSNETKHARNRRERICRGAADSVSSLELFAIAAYTAKCLRSCKFS